MDGVNRRIGEVVQTTTCCLSSSRRSAPSSGLLRARAADDGGVCVDGADAAQLRSEALDMGQSRAALCRRWGRYPAEYQAMFADLRWINDPVADHDSGRAPQADARPPLRCGRRSRTSERGKHAARSPRGPVEKLDGINALREDGQLCVGGVWGKTASGSRCSTPARRWASGAVDRARGLDRGGGLAISGMTAPGIPGIIIGRTPHQPGRCRWASAPWTTTGGSERRPYIAGDDQGGGRRGQVCRVRNSRGPLSNPSPSTL